AIEGTATDVHGISDRRRPVLKEETANSTRQTAKEANRRNHVALQSQGFRKPLHGKRRISVDAAIAGRANFLDGVNQLFRLAELTHDAVDMGALQMHYFSSSEVSATSS